MTLREIRKHYGLTQRQVGELVGTGQADIHQLENRVDSHVSTLRRFVEALGGELRVIARFPDQDFLITLGEKE